MRATVIVADVCDKEAMTRAAKRVAAELGSIDVLVANAAVLQGGGGIEAHDREVFAALMETNVLGTINTVQAALPALRRRPGGRIIITSSIGGRTPQPSYPIYGCSKWAVQGLMKSLAVELGGSGITVNCVAPGPVDTPLHNRGRPLSEVARADVRDTVLPVSVLAPEAIARDRVPRGAVGQMDIRGDARRRCRARRAADRLTLEGTCGRPAAAAHRRGRRAPARGKSTGPRPGARRYRTPASTPAGNTALTWVAMSPKRRTRVP